MYATGSRHSGTGRAGLCDAIVKGLELHLDGDTHTALARGEAGGPEGGGSGRCEDTHRADGLLPGRTRAGGGDTSGGRFDGGAQRGGSIVKIRSRPRVRVVEVVDLRSADVRVGAASVRQLDSWTVGQLDSWTVGQLVRVVRRGLTDRAELGAAIDERPALRCFSPSSK